MTAYRCVTHGHFQNGDVWSSSLRVDSPQTRTDWLTTYSNAWIASWTDGTHGLNALYHTDVFMDAWTIYELDGTLKATFKSTLSDPHAGASSDTPPANSQNTTVEWTSPLLKHRGRGFSKLPGLVEGVLVNGVYTPTAMTRVKAAMVALQTAIQADGSSIFTAPTDAKHPPKDGTALYTRTVMTGVRVSNIPGTTSRRYDPSTPVYT